MPRLLSTTRFMTFTASHEAHHARPGLSPIAASLLRSDGWDALHVIDAGLDRADDIQILEFARGDSRACVTLDHDFHAHLALAQMAGPSVVLVRLEGLDGSDQAALIRRVDAVSIRVRKLPLG